MRNKEFEIVRDLIDGRLPPQAEAAPHPRALAPAPFREIDGEVLARQYVAYRKFIETEAQARRAESGDLLPGSTGGPKLRGERRPEQVREEAPSGWLWGLSRLWRR